MRQINSNYLLTLVGAGLCLAATAHAAPSELNPKCSSDDFYACLDLPKDASQEQIKKHYRSLVIAYHPDTSGARIQKKWAEEKVTWASELDRNLALRQAVKEREDQFRLYIGPAYEVLSDPQRRATYDAEVKMRQSRSKESPRPQQSQAAPRSPKPPATAQALTQWGFFLANPQRDVGREMEYQEKALRAWKLLLPVAQSNVPHTSHATKMLQGFSMTMDHILKDSQVLPQTVNEVALARIRFIERLWPQIEKENPSIGGALLLLGEIDNIDVRRGAANGRTCNEAVLVARERLIHELLLPKLLKDPGIFWHQYVQHLKTLAPSQRSDGRTAMQEWLLLQRLASLVKQNPTNFLNNIYQEALRQGQSTMQEVGVVLVPMLRILVSQEQSFEASARLLREMASSKQLAKSNPSVVEAARAVMETHDIRIPSAWRYLWWGVGLASTAGWCAYYLTQ